MTFPDLLRLAGAALAVGVVLNTPGAAEDRWGEARNDLERFYGVYGTEGSHRDYFFAPAKPSYDSEMKVPEGHMMMGAMWGDVAPWYLKSKGDTAFLREGWNEYNPDFTIIFETGPDGDAQAFTHQGMTYEKRERLKRKGDLPEDW